MSEHTQSRILLQFCSLYAFPFLPPWQRLCVMFTVQIFHKQYLVWALSYPVVSLYIYTPHPHFQTSQMGMQQNIVY